MKHHTDCFVMSIRRSNKGNQSYDLPTQSKITRTVIFDQKTGKCEVEDNFALENQMVIENLVTSFKPVVIENGFYIATNKNVIKICVSGGKEFDIIENAWVDHSGHTRQVWLMQWKVQGKRNKPMRCKISIGNEYLR